MIHLFHASLLFSQTRSFLIFFKSFKNHLTLAPTANFLTCNFTFIKMLMTCFTYIQLFIKWFHWMIQFWSDNIIFSMRTQSDTTLIQTSTTYCANIMRILFYLLQETANLATIFFRFLDISVFDTFLSVSAFCWYVIF